MAWPSWFPTAARPSSWRDWGEVYKKVIPRDWPFGLFNPEAEAWYDLQAIGESLAMTRDMMQWVLTAYFPRWDTNAAFLGRWERVLGISLAATIAAREERVTSHLRTIRATMTQDQVKAAFARAFGSDSADDVSLTSPTAADIATAAPAEDWQWVLASTVMHIFSTGGSINPDRKIVDDLIDRLEPTGETWTCGQYDVLKWDTAGAWDQAVWS